MVSWFKRLFGGKPEAAVDHEAAYVAAKQASDQPWANFEVAGFEADGRVKVAFNWNSAFVQKVRALGFDAETEEDVVQLFFYASSLRPTQLAGDPDDQAVQSSAHPQLSQVTNEIRV